MRQVPRPPSFAVKIREVVKRAFRRKISECQPTGPAPIDSHRQTVAFTRKLQALPSYTPALTR